MVGCSACGSKRALLTGLLILVLTVSAACGVFSTRAPQPAVSSAGSGTDSPSATVPPSASTAQMQIGGSDPVRLRRSLRDNGIRFDRISLEEGLSQSVVMSIVQDSAGFMWFATQDGLNRYDGYDFVVYEHDAQDPNSLSDSFVQEIIEDRAGALWLGTNTGGLNRFEPETGLFTSYLSDPDNAKSLSNNGVIAICEDQSGLLWIGTAGGGLNRFDPQSGEFTRYLNDPEDDSSLSHNFVQAVYVDREGVIWVGTFGGGLNRFDRTTGVFTRYQPDPDEPYSIGDNNVQYVFEDSVGTLWIGTNAAGLERFDRDSGRFERFHVGGGDRGGLSDDNIQVIYEDRSGELWVGTFSGGLNRISSDRQSVLHYQNVAGDSASLSGNNIQAVFQSREGVLWFGTFGGGVSKFDRNTEQFALYRNDPSDSNSLSSDLVWSIHEDADGILWIATNGGGLNRLDRRMQQFTRYLNSPDDPNSVSDNVVYSIGEDRRGTLWVGTNVGLDRLDREEEQFVHYPTGFAVLSILEDGEGTLWVGTLGGGLGRFDREAGQFTFYQNDPNDPSSIGDNSIVQVYEDRQGELWLGTFDAGLDRFDREEGRFVHHVHDPDNPSSLSGNTVLAILEDSSGVLWVATTAGLNKFRREDGAFSAYREKDGLPNNLVYGVLEDKDGFLWLSTNGGLARFDPRTESFKNYDARDGLQSNEFNMSAYHQSNSGEMFFGGIRGFNAFYPEDVKDSAYVPAVVVTDFQLFNESVSAGVDSLLKTSIERTSDIALSYQDDFFSFEFAALHFSSPEQNQYAYMMEGLDKDWNYVGTRRFAGYTSVPPGDYTFRVKASNSDGLWNEAGTRIRITVTPPIWQTWWFRMGMVLLIAGGAVAAFRLRVRNIEAQSRRLEIQVNERTRELRETMLELEKAKEAAEAASRAKSVFLANMSHEFRTPLNAVLGFTQLMLRDSRLESSDQENLEIISRSGEHLLGLINDVLELSKIEAGRTSLSVQSFDLLDMLEGLEEMFRLRAEQKGVDLSVDIAPDVPRFVRLDQGKLRQVLMNLLGNAVKFTTQGGVWLGVAASLAPTRAQNATLHFQVRDTGPGIAPEEMQALFDPFVQTSSGQLAQEGTGLGLPISQQFVRLMGGEISVHSELGRGSTFSFDVPVDVVEAAAVETALPKPSVIGLQPGQPAYRLLVVDDKEANRKLLIRMLAPLGFDVREAANGQEALAIWEQWDPLLIFMDMRMPVMDGYEATRRIKATVQGHATVIVALTASALEEDRTVILSEGCDDYVRKPFREAELLAVLENHLGARFRYREPEAVPLSAAGPAQEAARPEVGPSEVERLSALPAGLLAELQKATVLGNLETISVAIDHIHQRDAALAKVLRQLARNYDHDTILTLLEQAGG